ncbi:MAG: putative MFS family arabinose efflux permease, partial [Halioglobus sp.]
MLGIAFAVVTAACPALIAGQARESDLRQAMGAWGTYMPAGSVTALLLGPSLIELIGWRGLWLFLGFASLATLLMWSRISPGLRVPELRSMQASIFSDIKQILRRPLSMVLALKFACYTLMFNGIMAWLPSYFI